MLIASVEKKHPLLLGPLVVISPCVAKARAKDERHVRRRRRARRRRMSEKLRTNTVTVQPVTTGIGVAETLVPDTVTDAHV